jgi:polyphosphate kinase 2 (PPK2 family)
LVKETGKQRLDDLHARLDMLQQRLYAESRRSVLVVIQGMDGSGKDGIVRRVFSGLNPQGCRVAAFKVPTTGARPRLPLARARAHARTR